MLTDILPPNARKVVYAVYAFVGLCIGATQVAYQAAEAGQPTWLTVALAVFGFVGVGIGATAAANTPPPPSIVPKARNEHGEVSVLELVAIVFLVAATLALFGVVPID